ncbi:hypothetical protein [Haloactinopolyspora sp.]|uniref:hypothetical protein n=1 Tax=Haloactinopolyspora sp. TaxID=1966353 RepID=UPI0026313BB9|nr:hypothetical protein [Haloactinopolyspora sp.]
MRVKDVVWRDDVVASYVRERVGDVGGVPVSDVKYFEPDRPVGDFFWPSHLGKVERLERRRQVTLIADELVAAVKVLDHCAGRVPSRRQRKVSPLTTRFSVAP